MKSLFNKHFSAVFGIIVVILHRIIFQKNNMRIRLPLLAFILLSLFLIHCKKDKNENLNPSSQTSESPKNSAPEKDSIGKAQDKADARKKLQTTFSSLVFTAKNRDSMMSVFNKNFSEKEKYTILALNRLDTKNKWRADTLMIPAKISDDFMDYSPFPYHLKILDDVKKMVIFSYPVQAYGVYSNGVLVKWGPTSMGKKAAQTKRGLMFANWKKELATSTVNKSWKLPYNFNIHNNLGIGWHQYDLPGFPASHSCLRLLMDDAKWLYNYADMWILNKGGATVRANGTPVIVFGDYAWGKMKPWKHLDSNPNNTDISENALNAVIEPEIDKILQEQKKREEIVEEIRKEKEKVISEPKNTVVKEAP